jgi:hypothetical protein
MDRCSFANSSINKAWINEITHTSLISGISCHNNPMIQDFATHAPFSPFINMIHIHLAGAWIIPFVILFNTVQTFRSDGMSAAYHLLVCL